MTKERIELPHCTLELNPEGIIICDQFQHVNQTRDTVEILLEGIREISDEPRFMVVRMNGQPTDKEARARIASASEMSAVAMVLSSRVGTMLVNFFLRMNKPRFPLKVFTDEEAALEWLRTMMPSPTNRADTSESAV